MNSNVMVRAKIFVDGYGESRQVKMGQ